jgi:hypothetical protein
MRRTAVLFPVLVPVLAVPLAACASSSTTAAAPPAVSTAAAASLAASSAASSAASAAASSAAALSPSAEPTTALDPCKLVTSSEASALAGTTFGPGKEEPSGTSGKRCVYGSATLNVFTVIVGQAATVADADAQWSSAQSEAQAAVSKNLPAGVSVSVHTDTLTGIADKAALASGSAAISGQTINEIAIYLLKGTTFLSFSDLVLNKNAPGEAAMKAEAQTALSRVP